MDNRIGEKMIHPLFNIITITDIREIEGYTLAYFNDNNFVNYSILQNVDKKNVK